MIDGTEEDQEFGLEDDSGAVIAAVGRQIKLWREAAGLRAAELGSLIGYSENMVFKVEGGRRIPQPDFLDRTDTAVGAAGKVAAMKKDVEEARYPRKVRDLAKLEAEAVELGAYAGVVIHGLLQTEEYARALYGQRQPSYTEDDIERLVAARMARQVIFDRRPAPLLTFVQEEATLRRRTGAEWSCVVSSNICWSSASCGMWRSRSCRWRRRSTRGWEARTASLSSRMERPSGTTRSSSSAG